MRNKYPESVLNHDAKMFANNGKPWTENYDFVLMSMLALGRSTEEIEEALERPYQSYRQERWKLGIRARVFGPTEELWDGVHKQVAGLDFDNFHNWYFLKRAYSEFGVDNGADSWVYLSGLLFRSAENVRKHVQGSIAKSFATLRTPVVSASFYIKASKREKAVAAAVDKERLEKAVGDLSSKEFIVEARKWLDSSAFSYTDDVVFT